MGFCVLVDLVICAFLCTQTQKVAAGFGGFGQTLKQGFKHNCPK